MSSVALSLGPSYIDELTCKDVPAVHRICVESFASPWAQSVLYEETKRPFSRSWVVRDGSHIAAFVGIWLVRDEIHVLNLATARWARRRGHGRALMNRVLDHAKAERVSYVSLEVDVENRGAIRLYRTLEFETIGVRPGYYNGRDAAVMLRSLRTG